MDDIIVGDEGCDIYFIIDAFKESTVYAKAFSEWKRLARELIKNPDTKIDKIRQDQKTLGIDDEDCVIKILQDWKLETGADATLQTLLDKLEKLKWKDCADMLCRKFHAGNEKNISNPGVTETIKVALPSNQPPVKRSRRESTYSQSVMDCSDSSNQVSQDSILHCIQQNGSGNEKMTNICIGYSQNERCPVSNTDYHEYVNELDNEIRSEIDNRGPHQSFQIKPTGLHAGKITVKCCNPSTANWVIACTRRILAGKFKVVSHDDCPSHNGRRCFVAQLDGNMPTVSELSMTLKFQNPALKIDEWIIMDIENRANNGEERNSCNVTFSIPIDLIPELSKINYTPFYLAGGMHELTPANCTNS